jgi:hypothetical protein
MGSVYHVSASHGIRRFEPRPFWHSPDLAASGRLAEGEEPPPGLRASRFFFAAPWEWTPWFFAPPELKRIGIWLGGDQRLAPEATPAEPSSGRALLFERAQRERLVRHAFSIYEFDDRHFTRGHGDERVADRAVEPLRETVHANALARIRERGIAVAFVEDIEARYRSLQRLGAPFFLIRHIDGAIADVAAAARPNA